MVRLHPMSLPARSALLLAVGAVAQCPALAGGDPPIPASASAVPPAVGGTGAKDLVPGYFDAATGTFRKLDPEAGTVTRNGTIKIVGTIVLNPGIPMTAPISLYPFLANSYATTFNQIIGGSMTAKRTGAHTATFEATVPYTLSVATGDGMANVSVTISTSAPGASGTTISWSGNWGAVVTLPPNGKTLTVKAQTAM